jgi:hypothetical protein
MSETTVLPVRMRLSLWLVTKSLKPGYALLAARDRLSRKMARGRTGEMSDDDSSAPEEDEYFVEESFTGAFAHFALAVAAVAVWSFVFLSLLLAHWRFAQVAIATWRERD